MKTYLIACFLFLPFLSIANIDRPVVSDLTETAFHADGWFSYRMEAYDDGTLRFKGKGQYVLAPRYAAPIRRVLLKVRSTSVAPGLHLQVVPFVDGVLSDDPSAACTLKSVATAGQFEVVSLDFRVDDRVDSFWIQAIDGDSGVWGIGDMCVFYGERIDEEDAILMEFARQLPTPDNCRVVDFDEHSLLLAADPVDGALGYRFSVSRLSGTPLTKLREDFSSAPECLSSGWTMSLCENAQLGVYTGSGYYDSSAEGKSALRIDKGSAAGGAVHVAIDSRCCEAPVTECSFFCKLQSAGSTDVFNVWGRSDETQEWTRVVSVEPVGTAKTNVTVVLRPELDIRQIRFEFVAEDPQNMALAAWDSLCLVYGGDEECLPIPESQNRQEAPACRLDGLETGRYVFKVQSLGGTTNDAAYGDSSWAEEQVVDLSWANVVVTSPTVLTPEVKGDKMTIRWGAVSGAEAYCVDVFPTEDPDAPVVSGMLTKTTSVTVTVPEIGGYSVVVTAVAPGGKSTASTSAVGKVELGRLSGVRVQATDRTEIRATWTTLPLATGYRAQLLRVEGKAVSETVDYPDAFGDNVTWGGGWSSYGIYETYAGSLPKILNRDSFVASRTYPDPITGVTFKLSNQAQADDDLATGTYVRLQVSTGDGGAWQDFGEKMFVPVNLSVGIPFEENVRRVRFVFGVDGSGKSPKAEFGKVTVSYGNEKVTELKSALTTAGEVTFSELDPSACYRVRVLPQPSASSEQAVDSETLDLSKERFRPTGAVPLSTLRGGGYFEDFSSLSNVVKETTEIRRLNLGYWQFNKGVGEADKLLYCTNVTRKTGGVYVFGEPGEDSTARALGTVSSDSMGYSFGIAFRNDRSAPVAVSSFGFQSIQRNFRSKPATYVLEWRMTDGETDIGDEGEWMPLEIPVTAPYTVETQDGRQSFRQSVTVVGLPSRIPVGKVLVLRWRHERLSSGPMMAIDDVRLDFTLESGLAVIVK